MTDFVPYEVPVLGDAPCPTCKNPAFFAWDDDMDVIALNADPGGDWAVSIDANRVEWCRPVTGRQLAFDEVLYRLHECPLADVITLADRRQPASRPESPRRASAR